MVTKSNAQRAKEWWEKHQAKNRRLTFAGDTSSALQNQLDMVTRVRFPTDTYRRNPVLFFREILGIDPWHRQVQVLNAIEAYKRVAVRSGHKVSKSNSIGGASLWFYCSFDDARAILTSTTSRQVDAILWRELRMMYARGGRCIACKLSMQRMAEYKSMLEAEKEHPRPCPHSALIDGTLGDLARTGLKSEDFREIVGFTAREAEAVAGVSGKNLLYLPDEASGIPQVIYDAIEGNRAGGARLAMFGNPTRNSGEFYDAFHKKKHLYHCITISSEETPNVVEGREIIPGLATREWIEEKKQEYGENSAWYTVRVKGEHAEQEEGKAFPIAVITAAEERYDETLPDGRLRIGIDPAGPTGTGDEHAFSAVRGYKQIRRDIARGLTEDGVLMHLLGMLRELREPREKAVVMLDREGKIGAAVYGRLSQFAETPDGRELFTLIGVRSSERAFRNPKIFDRVRDELASNLENWFREGGAIIEDVKLEAELHIFEWRTAMNGRMKLWPSKEDIRRPPEKGGLGRSPDRFDALCLSVWEPVAMREEAQPQETASDDVSPDGAIDPYAGRDVWRY